jgi:pentose-5-phosphate-3-epimerase
LHGYNGEDTLEELLRMTPFLIAPSILSADFARLYLSHTSLQLMKKQNKTLNH